MIHLRWQPLHHVCDSDTLDTRLAVLDVLDLKSTGFRV